MQRGHLATKVPVAVTEQASVGFSKVTKRLREGQKSSAPEQLGKVCLSCSGCLDLNHTLLANQAVRFKQIQAVSINISVDTEHSVSILQ